MGGHRGRSEQAQGRDVFPAVKDPMDVERPGTYAGIRTVVQWSRTSRGGRQYDMFFDDQGGGGCQSDLALCERSDP